MGDDQAARNVPAEIRPPARFERRARRTKRQALAAPRGGMLIMLAVVFGLNAVLGGVTFLANRKA
ncbi:hypothetical protein OT109_11970 [Phycisphaeraceae bacterium D3-23]